MTFAIILQFRIIWDGVVIENLKLNTKIINLGEIFMGLDYLRCFNATFEGIEGGFLGG